MHAGGDWLAEHNFTVAGCSVIPEGDVSFARGLTDCVTPTPPADVSSVAVLDGAVTVAVIVEKAFWLRPSETVYLIALAAPTNGPVQPAPDEPVAWHGENDTVPPAFTVYTPCPATVRLLSVQEESAVALVQMRSVDTSSDVPVPAESSANGEIVCTELSEPVDVLGTNVGTPATVGVIVELPVLPRESVDWYVTAVAVPVNDPVHDGDITGVPTPVQGVNDTVVPDTAYDPWPATTIDVAVQLGYD